MTHTLDLRFGRPHTIAAYLVETSGGPVLVETGPESTYPRLLEELSARSVTPADLRAVLVTHIHLDHSGAAWRLVEDGAPVVYVHPKGAPHLVDPTRLWESASRIYGERMEELWGRPGSIPEGRVRAVEDGETVSVGATRFLAVATPGHAGHHHAWVSEGTIFSGDVGGVRIGGGPVVPPFPPPEIHLELWKTSLDRLRDLKAEEIRPTHFGAYTDVAAHLDDLEGRMFRWAEQLLVWLREGLDEATMIRRFEELVAGELRSAGLDEEALREYEIADPAWMSVPGLQRYWQKVHPERVSGG